MIKVDQYQLIRRLYAVEGLSQREIGPAVGDFPEYSQEVL